VLITEGGTSTIFPEFNLTQGINIEQGDALYARGSVLKAVLGDRRSPVLYGYDQNALAVYFNQGPIFSVGGGGGFGRGGGRGGGPAIQGIPNMQPNAVPPRLTTLEGSPYLPPVDTSAASAAGAATAGQAGRGGRGGGGGGGFGGRGGGGANAAAPRVLLSFPTDPNDLLLSGLLVGADAIAGRAVAIDAPVGKGHVVMFANRPFWRWQTQGNFFLGFNTILNWNDLDAGRGAPAITTAER
jgi:hypothetical protein